VLSLGCKANARVFFSKTGHGPHSYIRPVEGKWFAGCIVGVDCCCYMQFWSVIVYHCHRLYTQLQLNKYHILYLAHWIKRDQLDVTCFIISLFNTLNAELNPTCQLLALFGAHHILIVSRIRVNTRHWIFRLVLTIFCVMIILLWPFKRRENSHLPAAGIIRSSPYSPR